MQGEKMAFERLSKDKIDSILELAQEGYTRDEIAKEVGVSRATVSKYIRKSTTQVTETGLKEVLGKLSQVVELLSERRGPEELLNQFDFCPVCQHILYLHRENEVPHLACYKCGWWCEVEEPTWQKQGEKYKIK